MIFVPKGAPHRFVVGNKGGHALIISPPGLEFYFFKVSELLDKGKVSYETVHHYFILRIDRADLVISQYSLIFIGYYVRRNKIEKFQFVICIFPFIVSG